APTGSPRPPGQSPVPARRHAAWHSAAPPRTPADATDIPSRARPQSARRPPPATDRPHQPTAPARADQPNRGLASLPPPRDQPFYPQATYFPNSYGKRSMVQGFAMQSGGAIRIRIKPGEGTTVELWLPRAAERPVSKPASRSGSELGRASTSV